MISRAFSSEVETGSRQENASNPKSRAPFRFNRNGKGSSVFGGLRRRSWTALCVGILTSVAAQAASAADCPGHPDAIGTSRTIVVDPRAYPVIGTMQYAKTLPLADREVVLTFDDGPLPKYSNQILDILAAHCAKATFFLVGRQADAHPEGVRKVRDAGGEVVGVDLSRAVDAAYEGGVAMFAASGDFLKAPLLPLKSPKSIVYPARFARVIAVTGAGAQ